MSSEKDEDRGASSSTRVVYFTGKDKPLYREWSMETEAIGLVKKWDRALLKDLKIEDLNKKLEDGEITTEEQAKLDSNSSAWTYLNFVLQR
jgi:hypothetical protein